jgi:hypothetical protein
MLPRVHSHCSLTASWPNAGRAIIREAPQQRQEALQSSVRRPTQFHRTPVKTKTSRKKTLSASHLPCVSAPPASLYGECGACWLDASSISRQCLLGRIIINRPMSAVSLGEGVLMRRLRATTETNALGFLSLPPLALAAAAAAVLLLSSQLLLVLGAAGWSARRQMEAPNALPRTSQSLKSISAQQRLFYFMIIYL